MISNNERPIDIDLALAKLKQKRELFLVEEEEEVEEPIFDLYFLFTGNLRTEKKVKKAKLRTHPFQVVDPSPWPFLLSFSLLSLTSGLVMWLHNYIGGGDI